MNDFDDPSDASAEPSTVFPAGSSPWTAAFRKSVRQFARIIPLLAAVVLLVGLFHAYIPGRALRSLFTGHPALDALLGTAVGALTTGNAVNSYVIGHKLLADGVGVHAVAAFVFAWATVGAVQLPAEMATLGRRFALARFGATVLLCIAVALLTGGVLNALDIAPAGAMSR